MFKLLRQYKFLVFVLLALTVTSGGLSLVVPKIIAAAIDSFTRGDFHLQQVALEFFLVVFFSFIFLYLQNIMQTFTSERVAKDLRLQIIAKISAQDYVYIQHATPEKLLTNLTSDVDAVKTFVSQAVVSLLSSVFIIITVGILLCLINWRLALPVLCVVPIIGVSFFLMFSRVQGFFKKSQEAIDWLNKVITESVLGAALVRILNAQTHEHEKFSAASTEAKNIGFKILQFFAALIPVVVFVANMAILTILVLGGHFVITGTMTLGNFTAFYTYLSILIYPIFIIGFMGNVIARATASFERIAEVLDAEHKPATGTTVADIKGDMKIEDISLSIDKQTVLSHVSFTVSAGSKTAIIGPTAAGKTQLLYLLIGLLKPDSGVIEFDGQNIAAYEKESFHEQIGFVFQDSIIFNLSLRENIGFSKKVADEDLRKAIATAELTDFIDALPEKLDTVISERGTSLSGGQKQRVMLARALAINPRVLFLDDFTARVDTNTERKILANIEKNYPGITLVSVTQKIAPVESYDQIVLLMEGEVLASGTHQALLQQSPEYVQIYESQRSTNAYELQA